MPTDTFARTIGPRYIDHGTIAPPPSKRTWYRTPQPVLGPEVVLKSNQEWKTWNELTIKVKGIMPEDLKTLRIWEIFSPQGYITFVEIYENTYGQREGTAKVRFSPPPNTAFWQQDKGKYLVESGTHQYNVYVAVETPKRGAQQVQSPIKKYVFYDPKMSLDAEKIHFGLMINPTTMMPIHETWSTSTGDTKFQVDLLHNRITAYFKVRFNEPGGACNRVNKYMFQVPFAALKDLQFMDASADTYALVLSLESPPQFYRKREDTQVGHCDEGLLWNEFDTWYRQTDIVYDPRLLQIEKVALHKKKPVIDIGKPRVKLRIDPADNDLFF
jgi:RNA-dependent RNA polymerase